MIMQCWKKRFYIHEVFHAGDDDADDDSNDNFRIFLTDDFRSIYDRTKKKNLAEEDEIKDMSEEGFIFLTGRFVNQNCFTLC